MGTVKLKFGQTPHWLKVLGKAEAILINTIIVQCADPKKKISQKNVFFLLQNCWFDKFFDLMNVGSQILWLMILVLKKSPEMTDLKAGALAHSLENHKTY